MPAVYDEDYDDDDDGPTTTFGTWVNAYAGYEKRRGRENRGSQTTLGTVGGADVTIRQGDQGFQFGALFGFNETKEDSDGRGADLAIFDAGLLSSSGFSGINTVDGDTIRYDETNGSITSRGWFAGLYGVYAHDKLSIDGLFKSDFSKVSKKSLLRGSQDCVNAGVTDFGAAEQFAVSGSVSATTYTVAANVNYRIDVHIDDDQRTWVEPTIGVRFAYVDIGSAGKQIDLIDGHVWRVQAGVRFNKLWINEDEGSSLLATATTLFYSDVEIEGFAPTVFTKPKSEDERKVRVKGQVRLKASFDNGFSANAQAEVYGGQDLLGLGGRLGGRFEW